MARSCAERVARASRSPEVHRDCRRIRASQAVAASPQVAPVAAALSAIDWIEVADDYVQLHVGARSYLHREPMRDREARLDPRRLVRIPAPRSSRSTGSPSCGRTRTATTTCACVTAPIEAQPRRALPAARPARGSTAPQLDAVTGPGVQRRRGRAVDNAARCTAAGVAQRTMRQQPRGARAAGDHLLSVDVGFPPQTISCDRRSRR